MFKDHDISDTILHMMERASHLCNQHFSEENIDGGVETVNVQTDEDMIVAICYISECLTFNRQIDLQKFNPKFWRLKILDTLLALLEFI
jgi:hypothetical protein